jgi:hypothetical protein
MFSLSIFVINDRIMHTQNITRSIKDNAIRIMNGGQDKKGHRDMSERFESETKSSTYILISVYPLSSEIGLMYYTTLFAPPHSNETLNHVLDPLLGFRAPGYN